MVQEGCSNSGGNGGCSSGGDSGTNSVIKPSAQEAISNAVETTNAVERTNMVERYPKRRRREVDYNEQLNPTEDDHYICK